MVKHLTTIKKEVENTVVSKVTCDLCGKEAEYGSWSESLWNVNEVEVSITIKHRTGNAFPESGVGDETEIDMCPTCFSDKLIPWAISQGADIKPKEWSY